MRIRSLVVAGLAAAAAASVLDPIAGRARRTRLREWMALFTLRRIREGARVSLPPHPVPPGPGSVADIPEEGAMVTVVAAPGVSRTDDVTIADRIRAKVLARPDVEVGSVEVNVVRGVASLRGELKDRRQVDEVVDLAGNVPGVRAVQNLIRLPESPTIPRPASPSLGDAWTG